MKYIKKDLNTEFGFFGSEQPLVFEVQRRVQLSDAGRE